MANFLDIGDRVTIRDLSSITHGDGDEFVNDDFDSFIEGNSFVVIATDQDNHYDAFFKVYHQDVVIASVETNKTYRISSFHIKKA